MNGETLLEIKDLEVRFPLGRSLAERILAKPEQCVYAVNGVDLSVNRGETVGLVGESGCGKSTLARSIMRLNEPSSGGIWYEGQNILEFSPQQMREARRHIQMIFQDPFASLNPRKTVEQIVGLPLRIIGYPRHRVRRRVKELLELVGLHPSHIDRFPHQFSGGQRQRIGIARALAVEPNFIVADEPVSALDVSIQAQIINLLQELQQSMGLTYLFITHDLSVVSYVSDRIAVMYLGRVVELAETDELFGNPSHPYTRALLSAIPRIESRGAPSNRIILEGSVPTPIDPPRGCGFYSRCYHDKKSEICEHEVPPLAPVREGHLVACHYSVAEPPSAS